MNKEQEYIPALKYHWLTTLYDPIVRITTRESTFKPALVNQPTIQNPKNILDVGCGTGTLTLLIKQKYPDAKVQGLDADAKALSLAEKKTNNSKVAITYERSFSTDLPYIDNSFDIVFSSLFFHHLTKNNKIKTMSEIYRVLAPEGQIHIADWGKAKNIVMRGAFYLIQILDGFETTSDNVKGRLPDIIESAGFHQVKEVKGLSTIFGTMSLYSGMKPTTNLKENKT